ncbi:acyl-CoA N-acyltransferase [Basidiobolus meristosporus CBS 931.73]|uniref:Acyl-CoA N-acyltransferase n=1 Tax=Basidiobolus meristosporus CBS 931.73 TaxID=1314790 RepID=A0A1Y1YUZ9_9FUNG|nr:acyl-CoA N-acyltransferase [Basidiobolus meristosporus CBS 931.73]|eukprot:ORY01786.1 acyl-CoA N-acyltransferase [Basidiobolus meristosporus CBS 931.73]
MHEEYIFRTLKEEELPLFFDHLAVVFQPKGTPRQYFVDHWNNDPYRDINGIKVALLKDPYGEKIVSTVRVFRRSVILDGTTIDMGGIGEVATLPSHLRKGLARRLLQEALSYMKTVGIHISSLHVSSGPAQSLYKSMGWSAVDLHYRKYKVPVDLLQQFVATPLVIIEPQPMDLSDNWENLERMSALHESVLTQRSVAGPIKRSLEYWREWIGSPSPYPERKVTGFFSTIQRPDGGQTGPQATTAYLISEYRAGHESEVIGEINAGEFIAASHPTEVGSKKALNDIKDLRDIVPSLYSRLFWQLVAAYAEYADLMTLENQKRHVIVRTPLSLAPTFEDKECKGIQYEDIVDEGFMYKIINDFNAQEVRLQENQDWINLFEKNDTTNAKLEHLFLRSDSF